MNSTGLAKPALGRQNIFQLMQAAPEGLTTDELAAGLGASCRPRWPAQQARRLRRDREIGACISGGKNQMAHVPEEKMIAPAALAAGPDNSRIKPFQPRMSLACPIRLLLATLEKRHQTKDESECLRRGRARRRRRWSYRRRRRGKRRCEQPGSSRAAGMRLPRDRSPLSNNDRMSNNDRAKHSRSAQAPSK